MEERQVRVWRRRQDSEIWRGRRSGQVWRGDGMVRYEGGDKVSQLQRMMTWSSYSWRLSVLLTMSLGHLGLKWES